MNRHASVETVATRESQWAGGTNDGFSISDVLVLLLNRRWLILTVSLFIAAAGSYYSYTQPVAYSAAASIALNPTLDLDTKALGAGKGVIDNSVVESEIEVIRSRILLEGLVETTGLGTIKRWLSDTSPIADAEVEKTRLVGRILESVKVMRRESSYVLEVRSTAPTPEGAASLSNAVVEAYISSMKNSTTSAIESGQLRRGERLEALRLELEQRNQAIADYMARSGLVSANGSTMVEQMIPEVRRTLANARTELFESQAQLKQLYEARREGGIAEGVAEVQNSATIAQLRSREIEARRRIANLSDTYGPQHPERIGELSELEYIANQIITEMDIIESSLQRRVSTNLNRVSEIEAELASLQGSLNLSESARVQLNLLQREADTTERIYRDLMLRSQDFNDRADRQAATVKLLSNAVPPGAPSTPRFRIWAAFWCGLGVFCGIAAAVIANLFHNKIIKAEDIERHLNVKGLVSVPHVRTIRGRKSLAPYLRRNPFSTFSECYRVLLSEVKASGVIAITSAMAGDGKTTTTLGLANIAAMSGMKVAVIDCDFRMRALTEAINVDFPEDLDFLFSENTHLGSAYVSSPEQANLHFYPLNENAAKYDVGAQVSIPQDIFDSLSENYDLVLLDCGPMLAVASTRIFANIADNVIVVSRWNKTPLPALQTAIKQIDRAEGQVLGVVLNDVNTSVAKYYSFSDTLYFGKAGKGYYTNKK
ncbi:MAG: polysaccharide biosynthesis tyrosine autokinase [Pseudomonadota bacterium]